MDWTRAALTGLAVSLAWTAPVWAQTETGTSPRDSVPAEVVADAFAGAFADPGAAELVLSAWAARRAGAEGLESYEARLVERMRVDVALGTRILGRERVLYTRERVADVHWVRDGVGRMRWVGRRVRQPAFGEVLARDGFLGVELDVERELDLDDIRAPFPYDPRSDRLDLLDADLLLPVSTAGLSAYRFESGDTLRLSLPDPARSLTVVQIRIAPRTRSWETVEGAVWFDLDTGQLVRAVYRPTGVWDHEAREPGDLDGVPGLLKPALGRVDEIVIEYGLHEQRWWLPRRLAASGVFDWGALVRMPLRIEWEVRDYEVNQSPGARVEEQPGDVRYGLRGRDGGHVEVFGPPAEALRTSPDLPEPLGEAAPLFGDEELSVLLEAFRPVQPAHAPSTAERAHWRGLLESLRVDRVRGLSLGVERVQPLSHLSLTGQVRLGTAGGGTAELRVSPASTADRLGGASSELDAVRAPSLDGGLAPTGPWWLGAYRRLAEMNDDWGTIGGLGNSASTLLLRHDDGEYYWASGAEAGVRLRGGPGGGARAGVRVALFGEHRRSAHRHSDFSLAALGSTGLRENPGIPSGWRAGVRASAGAQWGGPSGAGVWTATLRGEAAVGDARYARGLATLGWTALLGNWLGVGVRGSFGLASRDAPPDALFHPGGTRSLRAFRGGARSGEAVWLLRAEVGAGVAAARWVAFTDLGRAGARDDIPWAPDAASVGSGVSLLDGILRLDLARAVRGGDDWRIHFYLDGLL